MRTGSAFKGPSGWCIGTEPIWFVITGLRLRSAPGEAATHSERGGRSMKPNGMGVLILVTLALGFFLGKKAIADRYLEAA